MEPYIQGAGLDLAWWCWIIVDSTLISCLSWRALPPSIESSNSLSEILPPPISCHASSFFSPNRFLVSVNQDSPSRGGEDPLYFRLGRSRHSRNSPVHRLITRVRIQSAHSEKAFILDSLPQKKCLSIDPYSFGQSLHGLFTLRCTMLIGIGKDLLVHVLEGCIHGNHH